MKITFVLPMPSITPVGGYKVVYEYANRLAERGHFVTVAHKFFADQNSSAIRKSARWLKFCMRPNLWRPDSWMKINPKVQLKLIPEINDATINDGDAVFATAWQTVADIEKLSLSKGKKFYLIQHLETWSGDRDVVLDTWKRPLHKIVIARWLQSIAESIGEDSTYIPNGLDSDEFFIETPLESRAPLCFGTLYHPYDWKGTNDVLAAMALIRKDHPEAHLIMFGASTPTQSMPDWIEFHHKPSGATLRHLYNRMSVFISASWEEGWGLTPCEALLCGCAIAVSDNGGHREFAIHNETALIFPIKSPENIYSRINQYISERACLLKTSFKGNSFISKLKWNSSTDAIERLIESHK